MLSYRELNHYMLNSADPNAFHTIKILKILDKLNSGRGMEGFVEYFCDKKGRVLDSPWLD